MASIGHTYGPSCSLQADSNIFIRRASVASGDPPKVRSQFFYNSALPIDDPLSPVPLPSSSSTGPSKFPPRPFSVYDNTALEEAWQSLQVLECDEKGLETIRSTPNNISAVEVLTKIVRTAAPNKHDEKKTESNLSAARQDEKLKSRTSLSEVAASAEPAATEFSEAHCQYQPQQIGDPHLMLCDDPSHVPFDETMPVNSNEIGNDEFDSGLSKKRHRSPFRRKDKAEKPNDKTDASTRRSLSMHKQKPAEESYGSSPLERDTTGTPFLRVPSRKSKSRSKSSDRQVDPYLSDDAVSVSGVESKKDPQPTSIGDNRSEHSTSHGAESEEPSESHQSSRIKQKEYHQASVAVGVSRLHLVKMPELKVRTMEALSWER